MYTELTQMIDAGMAGDKEAFRKYAFEYCKTAAPCVSTFSTRIGEYIKQNHSKQHNVIPPMTHPFGKVWHQPSIDSIVIDDKCALMDDIAFQKLATYNTSNPSGAYEGKMWKAAHKGKYYLHWFDFSNEPEMCSHEVREIVVI